MGKSVNHAVFNRSNNKTADQIDYSLKVKKEQFPNDKLLNYRGCVTFVSIILNS